MDKLLISLGAIFFVALVIFGAVLVGTLGGAFTGWVVGMFFGDTILMFAHRLFGFYDFEMWQFGAFLGFVSAFFRSHLSGSSK